MIIVSLKSKGFKAYFLLLSLDITKKPTPGLELVLRLFVKPPLPLHDKKVLNHHFKKWVFAIMFLRVPHVF